MTDRGLAQDIDGKGETVVADFLDRLQRVLDVFTDDELPGHPFQVRADDHVHHLGGQSAADTGPFGAPFHDLWYILIVCGEILFDMAGKRLRGVQIREHINETEELDLEGLVFHGPFHDLAGPPSLVEDGWGFTADACKKFLTAFDDFLFQGRVVHGRLRMRDAFAVMPRFSFYIR